MQRSPAFQFSPALRVCKEGFLKTKALLFGEFIREVFVYQFVLDYIQLIWERVVSEKS